MRDLLTQQSKKSKVTTFGVIILTVIAFLSVIGLVTVWALQQPSWPDWSGIQGKTLWDLLALLVIPMSLAFITILFSIFQSSTEKNIEDDRQREAALQSFLDKVAELIRDATSEDSPNARFTSRFIRQYTLTTLKRLDGNRKPIVLQLLMELGLIEKPEGVVKLNGADFKDADLRWMSIKEKYLPGIALAGANLANANLTGTTLYGAALPDANLQSADLTETNFEWAFVGGADFTGANLSTARLENVRYNNKTRWPEGFVLPASAVNVSKNYRKLPKP